MQRTRIYPLINFIDFSPGDISGYHSCKCEDGCLLDVALCSLVGTDRRLRGAYCPHLKAIRTRKLFDSSALEQSFFRNG